MSSRTTVCYVKPFMVFRIAFLVIRKQEMKLNVKQRSSHIIDRITTSGLKNCTGKDTDWSL